MLLVVRFDLGAGRAPAVAPACLHGPDSEMPRGLALYLFQVYYIDCAITCPNFSPFAPSLPGTPLPSSNSPFSSCPWVVHLSSLTYPFPILFLTSPYFVPTNYAF